MIQLAKPYISDHTIKKIASILHSGNLVQGIEVQILEKKIADYIGVQNAICVSSGTATLHLSLLALGIGPGDEVILPAFSFVATANVIELVGAKPVFVDIDINTFNIDINKIQNAITPNTKAIMPVHEFGLAAEIGEIVKIAKKNNLYIIEDAACSLGAKENEKHVGSFGNLGSFSFHPRKAITSGEGGIVTTDNHDLAEKIRILRNHGIENIEGQIEFTQAGFNYRMTDFQAAMVNGQFENFNDILYTKNRIAEIYLEKIQNKRINLPHVPKNKNHTWQTFHIIVETESVRAKLIKYLRNNEIMSNYGAQCIPHMTYYKKKYGYDSAQRFPNAFKAYTCGLAIPLYYKLTESEIVYISNTINNFKL